jgi:hypothetical protein
VRAGRESVSSDEPGVPRSPRIREARLKPEFAHLYPPLEPDRWEPAALMADRVVAWLLRQPDKGYIAPERVLRSEHFEFRGGSEKQGTRHSGHLRRDKPGQWS